MPPKRKRAVWKQKYGVRLPIEGTRAHAMLEEIKAGTPYKQIARRFRVTKQAVAMLRRRAGLPKRVEN